MFKFDIANKTKLRSSSPLARCGGGTFFKQAFICSFLKASHIRHHAISKISPMTSKKGHQYANKCCKKELVWQCLICLTFNLIFGVYLLKF